MAHGQELAMAGRLFSGIERVMPRLLGRPVSPTSSRLTASLPPSAASDASTWQPQPQRQQQHQTVSTTADKQRSRSRASPPPRNRSVATETQLTWSVADYECSPTGETAKPEQQPGETRAEPGNRSASSNNRPLVVIDPREVKSVLSQVVSSTMRELLGRDQEARERCLLRQIRQTLSEFEASVAAIVDKLADKESRADRRQPDRPQRARVPVNNSAEFGTVRLASAAAPSTVSPSRETGQTIKESCRCQARQVRCQCSSDGGETDENRRFAGHAGKSDKDSASGRVALGESESYGCTALPLLYRPVSQLGCPGCTTVGVEVGKRVSKSVGGGRLQKNFNHHATGLTSSSDDSSSCSSSSSSSHYSICSPRVQQAPTESADSIDNLFGPLSNPEPVRLQMPRF